MYSNPIARKREGSTVVKLRVNEKETINSDFRSAAGLAVLPSSLSLVSVVVIYMPPFLDLNLNTDSNRSRMAARFCMDERKS